MAGVCPENGDGWFGKHAGHSCRRALLPSADSETRRGASKMSSSGMAPDSWINERRRKRLGQGLGNSVSVRRAGLKKRPLASVEAHPRGGGGDCRAVSVPGPFRCQFVVRHWRCLANCSGVGGALDSPAQSLSSVPAAAPSLPIGHPILHKYRPEQPQSWSRLGSTLARQRHHWQSAAIITNQATRKIWRWQRL